jgi:RNA polymerase sigma factor (sigma-70 family)
MSADPATDAELVAKSRRRDAQAFGSLVARHQDLVFGVALGRCGDPALAEDIAQEAFVTAWRDLDRLRDADRVGSWVAGIARNLAANATRVAARRAEAVLPAPADQPSPEDAALDREDRALLQRSLAEVPAPLREALVLFYLEGQSIAQVAAALGIREDLVKQRLTRGRRALRETIETRVESALARVRPGAGFGAGVIAAVIALPDAASAAPALGAAGKAGIVMTASQKLGFAAAVLAVAGGATWLAVRDVGADAGDPRGAAPAASAPSPAPAPAAKPGAPPASPTKVRRFADPERRDAAVAAIRAGQQRRAAAAATPTPSGEAAAAGGGAPPALAEPPDLDKEYVRSAVQGLVPLLSECYEQGLERSPTLAGRVMVHFTIEGEPDVGGLVASSTIDPAKTTLADPEVQQCIQETMYALEIDPPNVGFQVEVHYPFEFNPVPPPE